MQFSINNTRTPTSEFTYNDGLNFGRFSEHCIVNNFQLILTKQEFLDRLNEVYNTIKKENLLEDKKYNETSDFSKTNYCTLQELLMQPKALFEIFNWYLSDDFFSEFAKNKAKYIINKLEDLQVTADKVIIFGKVRVKKEYK